MLPSSHAHAQWAVVGSSDSLWISNHIDIQMPIEYPGQILTTVLSSGEYATIATYNMRVGDAKRAVRVYTYGLDGTGKFVNNPYAFFIWTIGL